MVALYKEKVQQDTKQKEAALLVAGRGQVDLMSSMKIARERREKQELEAAQAKAKVQSSGITCAFCSQMCGRDLKSCAEANGGRKALKTLIRSLETPGPEPPGQALDARLDLLYTCYTAVSWFLLAFSTPGRGADSIAVAQSLEVIFSPAEISLNSSRKTTYRPSIPSETFV